MPAFKRLLTILNTFPLEKALTSSRSARDRPPDKNAISHAHSDHLLAVYAPEHGSTTSDEPNVSFHWSRIHAVPSFRYPRRL